VLDLRIILDLALRQKKVIHLCYKSGSGDIYYIHSLCLAGKSKKDIRGNSVIEKKKSAFSTIHPKDPFVLPALCKILQKGIVRSCLDRDIEAVESFHISVALHAHHARHAVVRVCLWFC
jgi:hypothetical protein